VDSLVTLNFPSWNQVNGWLKQLEALRLDCGRLDRSVAAVAPVPA
jgi:hypothetical protein